MIYFEGGTLRILPVALRLQLHYRATDSSLDSRRSTATGGCRSDIEKTHSTTYVERLVTFVWTGVDGPRDVDSKSRRDTSVAGSGYRQGKFSNPC